jgi:hypothetical protein
MMAGFGYRIERRYNETEEAYIAIGFHKKGLSYGFVRFYHE